MTRPSMRRLVKVAFDRYGLSPEARKVAWESCLIRKRDGNDGIDWQAMRCYKAIARSLR